MFKGLLVEKHDQGEGEKSKFTATVQELTEDQLPQGDVTLDVAYSSFNYKDGLVTLGLGGLTKDFPHVPGIDMAGTVTASDSDEFAVGDEVILTGQKQNGKTSARFARSIVSATCSAQCRATVLHGGPHRRLATPAESWQGRNTHSQNHQTHEQPPPCQY